MNETELERLVVRLTGDGSSFQKMLGDAVSKTTEAVSSITAKMDGLTSTIVGHGKTIASALSFVGLTTSLSSAFSAFEEKQVGIIRMNATLEANGRDVKATAKEYLNFSNELEKVSTSSKGNTMNLLRMAESFGLTGQHAENAARNSVFLASALDGNTESASSYMRVAQALESGDTKRAMQMSRMIPQLRGVRDETEFLEKANKLLMSGQNASVELSNTTGNQIERLGRSFKEFGTELGGLVAEGIRPFIDGLKMAADWIKTLGPAGKTLIVVVLGLVGVLLLIPPVLSVIGTIWHSMTGGLMIVLALLVTAAVGVTALAMKFGGLSGLFGVIKEKALAAWEWLKPIRQAVTSLWNTIVEGATTAWNWIQEKAVTAWTAVVEWFGDHGIDFTDLRTKFQAAIIAIEFGMRNFGKVWEWVWAGAKLQFIVVADQFLHFFLFQLPAILDWFGTNWKGVFSDAFNWMYAIGKNTLSNYVTVFQNFFSWITDTVPKVFSVFNKVFENLTKNLTKLFTNLPALVKGTVTLEQLGLVGLTDGINEQFEKLDLTKGIKAADEGFIRKAQALNIPERVIGPLETKLREEFERLGGELAGDWGAFYAKKLKEFADDDKGNIKKDAIKLGNEWSKGISKGTDKLEMALSHTGEALARVLGFRDKFLQLQKQNSAIGMDKNAAVAAGAAPVVVNTPAAQGNQGQAAQQMVKTERLLEEIRNILERKPAEQPLKPAVV